ncbi:MAG: adenylate/guanylate cyclase domain-containing protein [Thermoanaerobaculia bacterium]
MRLGREQPETQYARSDEGWYVAYQVFGEGPLDILFIPNWMSNLDVMWEEPSLARYLDRLASFGRVICFDKRGSGVSDPVPLAALPTVDQWMDDARVVLDAVGSERAAIIGDGEGGLMAMVFAATYPERLSALVLVNAFARWMRDDDYPVGMPAATVEKLNRLYEQYWGVSADMLQLTAPSVADDPRFRKWFVRYQRLSMPRGAASTMYRWVTQVDVRKVLPSIRVPSLIVHRTENRHHRIGFGRFLAEQIAEARYVELPGSDSYPFHAGEFGLVLDEIQEFLTGVREAPAPDRILATVLFTDIVASTERAAEMGDERWLDLRQAHHRLVRDYLERFRGREIETAGDGFLATFDGPTRAVTCAAAIGEAVRSLGVELRVGLHTGEVELRGDEIGGMAVNIAARVTAAADEGGVLVTQTVKDLIVGSGIELTARGSHELKGVPGEWPLFEVTSVP